MAIEKVICRHAVEASADLSAHQYQLVKLTANGLAAAVAGDRAFVLLDKPKQGQTGTIALDGIVKVQLGGTVAAGDYLSSDANGKAVKATDTVVSGTPALGTEIIGQALEAGVAGDLIAIHIGTGRA